jgi:hypothetical protein
MSEKQQDFPPDICGNVIEHLNEEIERYSLFITHSNVVGVIKGTVRPH